MSNEEVDLTFGEDRNLIELSLRNRLKIEPEELDSEFQRCPGQVAYLGALSANAIGEHLRAKSKAKRIRGLVYIETRLKIQNNNGRATEEHVKAAVEQDQRVIDADDEEITAEVARERKKTDLSAMVAKKEMLIQLGAARRQEMNSDPSMRNYVQGRKALHREG